jgi:mono/diheme cytochrome c family protein
MFGIVLSLLILFVLAVLCAWLLRRAWRASRPWVKWSGVVLAGLFTFIFVLVTAVGGIGAYRLFAAHNLPIPSVTVEGTSEQVARGEYLSEVLCAACHSTNGEFPMNGGGNLAEETGLPLGDLYAPNITPAGHIGDMSDGELFRLLRTGVDDYGRATTMTALVGPRSLSDEDTLAVIAYLRSAPPVAGETPPFSPSFLTALLAGAGLLGLDVPSTIEVVTAPPRAATVEYGEYVFNFMDCGGCHGPELDGNVPPPAPPAPDIRAFGPSLSLDQIFAVVRAQATAAGPDEVMPWRSMALLDDLDLEALYLYLHGLR